MNWDYIANLVEVNYGVQVDWEERFFICPNCGEPIYECDWADTDLINGNDDYICPICEEIIER
jgi:predicted RNA-binding Zn-ribbon protein involved in translation (DUF1610 family)